MLAREVRAREDKEEADKKLCNDYQKAQESAMEPEHARMWNQGPWATTHARPHKNVHLFREPPAYARRFGDLTYQFLLAVSQLLYYLNPPYILEHMCIDNATGTFSACPVIGVFTTLW